MAAAASARLQAFVQRTRALAATGGGPALSEIAGCMAELQVEDLVGALGVPTAAQAARWRHGVQFMLIDETPDVHIGLFVLRRSASIPIHDHPGMSGLSAVVLGEVVETTFVAEGDAGGVRVDGTPFDARVAQQVVRTVRDLPRLFTPEADSRNLHTVTAGEGHAVSAFVDVFTPPYRWPDAVHRLSPSSASADPHTTAGSGAPTSRAASPSSGCGLETSWHLLGWTTQTSTRAR